MRLDATTIEELFAAADGREDDLREIDRIIVENAPAWKRELFAGPSITMIGYGEMSWADTSGADAWPVIGLTAQKRHIALYVAAERDGVTLAELYRDRLGRTNNGKGCIRFTRLANIDPDQLAQAVRDAVAWAEQQERELGGDGVRSVES